MPENVIPHQPRFRKRLRLKKIRLRLEEWRAIPGYEGLYEVSNRGCVRSLGRTVQFVDGRFRTFHPLVLRYRVVNGYRRVSLHPIRRPAKTFKICWLVLLAFVGPRPIVGGVKYQACHYDGDSFNDSLKNLRWDTPSNNAEDSRRIGTMILGEKSGNAKLKSEWVRDARLLYRPMSKARGIRCLAKRFGVNEATMNEAIHGEGWKHVPYEVGLPKVTDRQYEIMRFLGDGSKQFLEFPPQLADGLTHLLFESRMRECFGRRGAYKSYFYFLTDRGFSMLREELERRKVQCVLIKERGLNVRRGRK